LNRNRLIAGLAILVTIIGIAGVIGIVFLLNKWRSAQSQVSQRSPVLELTYCNSNNTAPCIVSFGIDPDGNMLVNLLVPNSSFPDFYLKIVRNAGEHIYECEAVENFRTSFYCIGEKLPPGSGLQFMLVSSGDDTLLAVGELSIIGMAFPTLGISLPTSTPPATGISTQGLLTGTPTPIRPTPSRASPTSPSYPNLLSPTPTRPSYPNPSPSYP